MCVQTILGRTGCIDLLVNNAGEASAGALEESSLEEARAQFDTNVFGVLRLLKAVLPVMRKQGGGQMITLSSLLGLVAMPSLGLSASSKFAACGPDRGTLRRTASFSSQGVTSRACLFSHELRRAASSVPTGCVCVCSPVDDAVRPRSSGAGTRSRACGQAHCATGNQCRVSAR